MVRPPPRVVRLGEHFTAEDLKELGAVLNKNKAALTDDLVDALIDSVPPGEMKDFENILRRGALERSMQPQPEESFDPSATGARIDRPRPPRQPTTSEARPVLPPGHRLAEIQAERALEAEFGPGWEPHPRFRNPGAAENENLGSTIPEYYNSRRGMAAEVKRWNPEGLGIAQDGRIISPTPEKELTKAIGDARRQLATRRQNLPATQIVIFNITGYGVTNIPNVGAAIRNLIEESGIRYDRVFLQNGSTLTEIQ